MIRMLKDEDIFAAWWWLNWYTTHTRSFLRQEPLDNRVFTAAVKEAKAEMPWLVLLAEDVPCALAGIYERNLTEEGWSGSVLVCTAPDLRRQGYGRRILKVLTELAEKDGYACLQAKIIPANEAGLALLKSCRYTEETAEGEEILYRYEITANAGRKDIPENTDPYGTARPGRVPV
ncbi:MAG: GNAT family N-acetyltransferase [Solobacterium sp.]|nr:GNAT family N-acetyltransferase [Solobacterium sp.]